MKFNYEDFKSKKDEINLREAKNMELKKELENFESLIKISAEERKNSLSNMVNDIIATINLNNAVIQENKIYINQEQSSIGKEIKEYLNIIRDEVNDYTLGDDKSLIKLKECINNISESLIEINLYVELIEDSNKEINNVNTIIKNIDNKIEKYKNNTETGDNEFPNYLISKEYEFSAFLPNNKTGYSLKSFFLQHKAQIIEVLAKFNNDKFKAIRYFQKIHGLYGNTAINENTMNVLFSNIGVSTRKTKLSVKINNLDVVGDTDLEIFIKSIEIIGVDRIFNNCKSTFDKSFNISLSLLNNMNGSPKEILINNKIYYLYSHSSTEIKFNKLNNIKNILKNNLIILYK